MSQKTSKVRNFAKMSESVSVGQEQYPIRATRKSRNWSMSAKWVQVSHKYHKYQNGSNYKSVSISHKDREELVETGQYR